jgi:hypothetical protein
MRVLINEHFRIVRVGAYVEANAEAKEFILDTEASELSKSVLAETCDTNKFEYSKKATVAELLEAIEAGVEANKKIARMDKKPDSLVVKELVEEALEKGKGEIDNEDMLLMSIVQAGVKFKDAGRLYKQTLIDLGALVSSKDRTTQCRNILVSAEFMPKVWADVDAMIETLVDKVNATEYSQAYAQVRKYAKEFGIKLPIPEKKVSSGGFRAKIYAFMVSKPLATKEDFYQFIVEKHDKEEKLADKYWPIFELAKKVAEATIEANS